MNVQVRTCLMCTVLLVGHAYAQQQSALPRQIPAAKRQKIEKLIQLTGIIPVALNTMSSSMANMKKLLPWPPKAQDDFVAEMVAAVTPEQLLKLFVPIYDKYLSEEDLDGVIAYYQSPLGQKMIRLLPQMTAESQATGQRWGSELGKEVGTRIGRKVQEGAYGPWPPPPPAQQKPPEE